MGLNRLVSISIAVALLSGGAAAQSDVVQAFDAQVPFAPVIADSAGAPQLAYELHLTNFARQPIEIERVTVANGESGAAIGAAAGDVLAGLMGRPVSPTAQGEIRTIQPGMRGIIYFNLPLSGPAPSQVAHRIEFRLVGEQNGQPRTITVSASQVGPQRPIALGPPLRGGPWAAVYAPEMERGHRRVVYATNGVARIPGRFAIDWIRLDQQGRMAPDRATRLDAFYGYGADVLAVADATVAAVRDDMAEAETRRRAQGVDRRCLRQLCRASSRRRPIRVLRAFAARDCGSTRSARKARTSDRPRRPYRSGQLAPSSLPCR